MLSATPEADFIVTGDIDTALADKTRVLSSKLSAEQAATWGLIWQCVDDDQLATEIDKLARHFAQAAMDVGVFGAPSYVIDGELFWGQDRLDFVARKLRA